MTSRLTIGDSRGRTRGHELRLPSPPRHPGSIRASETAASTPDPRRVREPGDSHGRRGSYPDAEASCALSDVRATDHERFDWTGDRRCPTARTVRRSAAEQLAPMK